MRETLSGFNGSLVLEPGAQTDTHLYDERIAVVRIIALQPQHPCVDVRHQRPTTEDVGTESAVRTLGHTAISANGWEAREQNPELGVKAPPRRMKRRLVSRGKQDGIRITIGRATRPHAQWRVIDLQAEGAPLLLITAEPDAYGGTATLEGPAEGCQHANGRPDGAIQQLRLRVRTERKGDVGAPFERLDGAVRDLKEPSLDEGGSLLAKIDAHAETEAQSELVGCLRGCVATQQRERRVLVAHTRQPDGARRKRRDAFRPNGIVVRFEPHKRHLSDAAVVRELAVARHSKAEFAVVAGENCQSAAERRERVAAAGAVFERDGRDRGTDAHTPLRDCIAGNRERDEDNRQGSHEETSTRRARECRDCRHFMSNPTTSPAAFMRTSHSQHVAICSCRTLAYQTPLPTMARKIVGSHSTVANSMPANAPPCWTHSAPRKRP